MKNPILLFALTLVTIFFACNRVPVNKQHMVNPILGNISFETKYGYNPTETTSNQLRIKTHLEYVEHLLRQKDVSNLSTDLQLKREHLLDLLHDYWTAEIFPKNYDYQEERKPCFIDKNGTICAVGYLVEQTTNRQVAEGINNKHQYENLLDMKDDVLDAWIENSGLTKQECAMIQPNYGPMPVYTYNYITPQYGITSAILSGANVSFNTMNVVQIIKRTNSTALPVMGIITGVGQFALGAALYQKEHTNALGNTYINESQNNLSLVNMSIGTTTIILSSWNLYRKRKPKDTRTTWNMLSYPTTKNNMGFGLKLTRRI
jgi:hypothetical protein